MRPCRRRKTEITNWSFELRSIYEFALTPSSSLFLAVKTPFAAGAATGRRRVAPPAETAFPVPGFAPIPASLAPCTLATRPRRPSARHAVDAVAVLDVSATRVVAPFNHRRRSSRPHPVTSQIALLLFPLVPSPNRALLARHCRPTAARHGCRPSLRHRAPTSALPRLQLTPGTEPSRPRKAPEPAHRRSKLPASCRRGTHGRRRLAPVELTPPASILKNRPAQQLPHPPTVLADPSAPLFPRRSAASAGTVHRRPPCSVEPPPRASSPRTEDTQRCVSVPSPFSPTFPPPPVSPLAGKQRRRPSPVLFPPPRASREKK